MALIRNQPRSATARAACATELMVIRRKDFFEILRTEQELAVKLLWAFTGVLANRLEETTRDLGRAREELAFDVTCELFEEEDERITLELPAVQVHRASAPPPPGNGLSG
jgi:PPM family protein phosphatase